MDRNSIYAEALQEFDADFVEIHSRLFKRLTRLAHDSEEESPARTPMDVEAHYRSLFIEVCIRELDGMMESFLDTLLPLWVADPMKLCPDHYSPLNTWAKENKILYPWSPDILGCILLNIKIDGSEDEALATRGSVKHSYSKDEPFACTYDDWTLATDGFGFELAKFRSHVSGKISDYTLTRVLFGKELGFTPGIEHIVPAERMGWLVKRVYESLFSKGVNWSAESFS